MINIKRVALNRLEKHNLTIEQQTKRLNYMSNKNSLEAKVLEEVIRLLEQIEFYQIPKQIYINERKRQLDGIDPMELYSFMVLNK